MSLGRYTDYDPLEGFPTLPGVSVSGSTQGIGDVYRLDISAGAVTVQVFFGPNGHPFRSAVVFSGSIRINNAILEDLGLTEVGAVRFGTGQIHISIPGIEKEYTGDTLATDLADDLANELGVNPEVAARIAQTLEATLTIFDSEVVRSILPIDSIRLPPREGFAHFAFADPVLVVNGSGSYFLLHGQPLPPWGQHGSDPDHRNIVAVTFSSENFAYVTMANDDGTSRIREVWHRDDADILDSVVGYDFSSFGFSGNLTADDVLFHLVALGFTVDGIQYELDARDVAETYRAEVFDSLFSLMIAASTEVDGTAGNDLINATYVDADGDSINDDGQIIRGLAGNDLILAGGGDDRILPGSGNDSVLGGRGTDTAVFAGDWEGFTFAADAEDLIVQDQNTTASGEGRNSLSGVERLAFADGVTGRVILTETRLQVTFSGAEGERLATLAFDNGNMASWAAYDIRYAPDGNARRQMTVTYDDGRIAERTYDARGVLQSETITDAGNVHPWATSARRYAPDGQTLRDMVITFDDGRVLDRDYDADGTRQSQTVTDTADAFRWASATRSYAPDGQTLRDMVIIFDDGRVTDRDYDTSGTRRAQTVTDTEDAFVWASATRSYAPDGRTLRDMVITFDDGRVMDRDYDASGTRRAQTVTDTEDVYRWASYTRTYDAEGQVIATVFVDDPV